MSLVVTVTFDEFTETSDAERAIRGLDSILKLTHHPAQIDKATIESRPIVPQEPIVDAEFTVVEVTVS